MDFLFNLTYRNLIPGTSSTSKRSLELSTNDTRDVNPNQLTSTSQCSGDKRQKTITSNDQHEKTHHPRTDHRIKEAVRKWQLSNLAKCVFDNTVNMVLESLPEETDETATVRQETLNMINYNIEDEAVMMAIEEHGLRHQTQSDSSSSSSSAEDSSCSSSVDIYQRTNSTAIDTYFHGQDNQEFNFENNFLVTAVSAAIEEKGLSMYHV